MKNQEYLYLKNITKCFKTIVACDNINLSIMKGDFFFILGPSGCGKTTLLRIIAGLLEPDRGSVFLRKQCLNGIPPYQRDINTVFQNYALFPHLTVLDNVAFGLKMKAVSKANIRNRVAEVLDLVELEGLELRKPSQLSGGQQQRVALARALVNRPSVLLLDEPLGALDVKLRKQMQLELKHLQKRLQTTFIYVTHNQEEAITMADRIAIMRTGNIEQIGSPDEVYNHPKTKFVASFIGDSNFFESSNVVIQEDMIMMKIDSEHSIRARLIHKPEEGTIKTLVVRPEIIRIRGHSQPYDQLKNYVKGRIEEIIYMGTMLFYLVRLKSGQMIKVLEQNFDRQSCHKVGDTINLEWEIGNTAVVEG